MRGPQGSTEKYYSKSQRYLVDKILSQGGPRAPPGAGSQAGESRVSLRTSKDDDAAVGGVQSSFASKLT